MHYVGWWPDAEQQGQGIAILDKNYVNQGLWGVTDGFPNDGADLYAPDNFASYDISDLSQRELFLVNTWDE